MSSDVVIRDAVAADMDRLSEVFRASSWSNEGDRPALVAHPEWLVFDGDGIDQARTRAAVIDDEVVGFSTISEEDGALELVDLFVHPDSMRHGVGRALIVDVSRRALASGIARIDVDANHHALAFYRSVGFVGERIVPLEYGTAFRMHLDVS